MTSLSLNEAGDTVLFPDTASQENSGDGLSLCASARKFTLITSYEDVSDGLS